MAVHPVVDALYAELSHDSFALWRSTWHAYCHSKLVDRIYTLMISDNPRRVEEWLALDDKTIRRRRLPKGRAAWEQVADKLLELHAPLNDALVAAGLQKIGKPKMRMCLIEAVGPLQILYGDEPSRENPFPSAWRSVAEKLAKRTFNDGAKLSAADEHTLLDNLLVIAFLWTCKLPYASQVHALLAESYTQPLRLRGLLSRIPEKIAASGIADQQIPQAVEVEPPSMVHTGLSVLIEATGQEMAAIRHGRGFMHRTLAPEAESEVPRNEWGLVEESMLRKGRVALHDLYENTILSYMAISSIEQILRSFASRLGIRHLKPNGQPHGVNHWFTGLNFSAKTHRTIATLFDPNSANIRNRLMHGNLMEIESKSSEAIYSKLATDARLFDEDPYLPRNIANVCVNTLIAVDEEVAEKVQLTPRDLNWATGLMLTQEELEFGRSLHVDMFDHEPEKWQHEVTGFMDNVFPGYRQPFMLGVVGWMQIMLHIDSHPSPPFESLPRFMSLGLVFESLYRLVAHVLGHSILQHSVTRASNQLHCQYRMLDNRPNGICTPTILNNLVVDLPVKDQQNALRCLQLAIKARNAISHGALVEMNDKTAQGLGHAIVKSTQLLLSVAQKRLLSNVAGNSTP